MHPGRGGYACLEQLTLICGGLGSPALGETSGFQTIHSWAGSGKSEQGGGAMLGDVHAYMCSVVSVSETPTTAAHQAPLSMGLSWQEY